MNMLFKRGFTNLNQTYKFSKQFQKYTPTYKFATDLHSGQFNVGATKDLTVGVPKEIYPDEKRVALSPEAAAKLIKQGFNVVVESGAGISANFSDDKFVEVGAKIVDNKAALGSDIVLKVRQPEDNEIKSLKKGATSISFLQPAQNDAVVEKLKQQGVTSFAMDQIPRISRAQVFDALSSMANIAGYKAVIEAATQFGRFFTGQITAAGRLPPAKVLVIGGGVAGLSAIATAKSLGAIVRAFDTRPAVKEQVESLGATFLTVNVEEDGEGKGGYAKEMSKEFIEAEMALFKAQAKEVDIIITTALIPGREAPELILEEHVKEMKPGSVIVDLASEAGGNCKLVQKGKIIEKYGVKIVGYTDFPSRLAGQSSSLYANNITKFLSSMVNKENQLVYDLEDDVVGRAIVTRDGNKLWPNPKPLPMLDAAKPKKAAPKVVEVEKEDPYTSTLKNAIATAAGLSSFVGLGVLCPEPAFLGMVTTFSLAVIAGYQSVWSVQPALHTPLMSVTNAVSGLTAAGGLLCLGGGVFPHTYPQFLASVAVLLSTINITGGFIVSKRMLDMFKRKTDAPEHNYLYSGAGVALLASLMMAHRAGIPHVYTMGYLASSICCIGAICGLSQQSTARIGNQLGMIGVAGGIGTTVMAMSYPGSVFTQAVALMAAGGVGGAIIGNKVQVTELPQTVAAFHSLVGLAAVTTSMSSYMQVDHKDLLHVVASFFGVFIGGVTFTGSLAAFRKLHGLWPKDVMNLPMAGLLNKPICAGNAAGLALMCKYPDVGGLLLTGSAISSSVLGWNITNNIGSADMPVAITVLNSYSGWALCAEGFMLGNPLLTIVGSLIGSSGAILSYIMCKAMNRSLENVIFGSYAELGAGTGKQMEVTGTHVETNVDQVAELLQDAKEVIIVPGYGLAVAQGQYIIGEIAKLLMSRGIKFRFAIHPVAGRMPGQLNVLLAEVGIPYDIVEEMEEINDDFPKTDVCLVVGANDIVNSSALEDENSPIWGMPVLKVWEAKNTIVIKRTMGTGYADIQNPLFFKDNTSMLLGNAKTVLEELKVKLDQQA